jgi:thiol-disulfide isomerase/thioredoxin
MVALALAVLLRASAPCAGAASLSDAKDNIETVIRTYVANKSSSGFWLVTPKGGGKPLRLTLKSLDQATVLRTKEELFKAAVVFTNEETQRPVHAEFEVDFGTEDWHVARVNWITRAKKDALAKAASAGVRQEREASAASAAARAARAVKTAAKRSALPPGTEMLPEISLTASNSNEAVPLASCPTAKCLTVYVAPWCPHCRNAGANILSLRDYLKAQGIETRIVVGDDAEDEVDRYASSFGNGTLVDPAKTFKFSGGVPHLFVTEDGGRILKQLAGFYEEPMAAAELAATLDLP